MADKAIEQKNNKYKHDCFLFVILRPCKESNTLAYSFTIFSDNKVEVISDAIDSPEIVRVSREITDLIKDIIARGIVYANSLRHSSVYIQIEFTLLGNSLINRAKSDLYNEWKIAKSKKFTASDYKTLQGYNLKALEDIKFSSKYLSDKLRSHCRKQEEQLGYLIAVRAKRKRWKDRKRRKTKENFLNKYGKPKRSITNEE